MTTTTAITNDGNQRITHAMHPQEEEGGEQQEAPYPIQEEDKVVEEKKEEDGDNKKPEEDANTNPNEKEETPKEATRTGTPHSDAKGLNMNPKASIRWVEEQGSTMQSSMNSATTALSFSQPTTTTAKDAIIKINDNELDLFDIDEIKFGRKLGEGTFASAYAVQAFQCKENDAFHRQRGRHLTDAQKQMRANIVEKHTDTNPTTKSYYAIKNLLPQSDPKRTGLALQDFITEANILVTLNHPNIIKAYSCHMTKDGKGCYILMDQLCNTLDIKIHKDWKSIKERANTIPDFQFLKIWASGKSNLKNSYFGGAKGKEFFLERLRVGRDLCSALTYLHQNRIVYRDLKPGNIGFSMIQNTVKLFDFGLARFLPPQEKAIIQRACPNISSISVASEPTLPPQPTAQSALGQSSASPDQESITVNDPTSSPTSAPEPEPEPEPEAISTTDDYNLIYKMSGRTGTLLYMSPEVFKKLPYNQKSDVYAFGHILWEIISIEKPYQKHVEYMWFNGKETMTEAVFEKGERPPLKKKWPAEIQKILKQCWAHNLYNRPTMENVYQSLKSYIQLLEDADKPPTTTSTTATHKRNNSLTSIAKTLKKSDSFNGKKEPAVNYVRATLNVSPTAASKKEGGTHSIEQGDEGKGKDGPTNLGMVRRGRPPAQQGKARSPFYPAQQATRSHFL